MSFYPHNNITLSFIDETILNMNKTNDDIIINLYKNGFSRTYANVSVSSDNINYMNLGVLNYTNTRFNLEDINLTVPIGYIRLEFEGDNLKESLNIISIRGAIDSLYGPEYSYLTSVPYSTRTDNYLFVNDCNYLYSCYTYCRYSTSNFNSLESCFYGCDYFHQQIIVYVIDLIKILILIGLNSWVILLLTNNVIVVVIIICVIFYIQSIMLCLIQLVMRKIC